MGGREVAAHASASGVVAERLEEEEGDGAHASVREGEGGGLGQAGREAKAQEEWGGSGPIQGQGPGGWAKN
jgi:hypothetical protein